MLEIVNDSTFKLKKTVTVRNILNETFFLLDSDTGKQYNLSEMEYEILNQISQGDSFKSVVNKVSSVYDAPLVQIEKDLREYYIALLNEGIIA